MYYPSGLFRRKALAALKGHWQAALLVALIVNLPTLLMQGFSTFTGNDPVSRLEAYIITASRDGVLTQQALLGEIQALLSSTGFWTVRGLEVLAWLVTPCLTLGMYRWIFERLAGNDAPVSTVFCRMRLFLRAIGLQLLIILKVLAWMLPGIAAGIAVLMPAFRAADSQSALAALESGYSMFFPVTLLMVVPAVMAALRYALADYIMAEGADNRILFCIRRSKYLMKDQKKNLFFLMASFLLWYLLSLLISSMLSGVFSLLVQMLASLALSVYMSASVAVFYRHLDKGEAPTEPEAEELN